MYNVSYQYPFRGTDETTKRAVWNKGTPIPGYDAGTWRLDACGHVIAYAEHGNTSSSYGWEIDHIIPRERGGPTTWENLQPLYWGTNRSKADRYPWSCAMA